MKQTWSMAILLRDVLLLAYARGRYDFVKKERWGFLSSKEIDPGRRWMDVTQMAMGPGE